MREPGTLDPKTAELIEQVLVRDPPNEYVELWARAGLVDRYESGHWYFRREALEQLRDWELVTLIAETRRRTP